MKPTLLKLTLLSLFILVPAICCTSVVAQSPGSEVSACKVGVRAPAFGYWMWRPRSQVKVFVLSTDFKIEEIPYLLAPVESWNAVAEASTSQVRFVYEGTVLAPQSCKNCLTIMRGKVLNKKNRHVAELEAYSIDGDQIITHAKIVIDPVVNELQALSNSLAHELGHNFGLLDCYSCKDHSTVMNVINDRKGLKAPTACDVAQVKRAYEELRTHVRPSPNLAKIPIDDGEEPVDDDTPIVVPDP
jgi:hypothetical protein